MSSKIEKLIQRIKASQHAMQSGVLMSMGGATVLPMNHESGPKHLRVGVNSAMVDHGALANLLMDKGVFTKEEYLEYLAVAYEKEQARYEKALGCKLT